MYATLAYLGYWIVKGQWLSYKYRQTAAKGKRAAHAKLSKTYQFKEVANETLILSLDVKGLRDHLHKGTFTCSDLVNVFGMRCYTIGRELCLTAEENFEEAMTEAAIKDTEIQ